MLYRTPELSPGWEIHVILVMVPLRGRLECSLEYSRGLTHAGWGPGFGGLCITLRQTWTLKPWCETGILAVILLVLFIMPQLWTVFIYICWRNLFCLLDFSKQRLFYFYKQLAGDPGLPILQRLGPIHLAIWTCKRNWRNSAHDSKSRGNQCKSCNARLCAIYSKWHLNTVQFCSDCYI